VCIRTVVIKVVYKSLVMVGEIPIFSLSMICFDCVMDYVVCSSLLLSIYLFSSLLFRIYERIELGYLVLVLIWVVRLHVIPSLSLIKRFNINYFMSLALILVLFKSFLSFPASINCIWYCCFLFIISLLPLNDMFDLIAGFVLLFLLQFLSFVILGIIVSIVYCLVDCLVLVYLCLCWCRYCLS